MTEREALLATIRENPGDDTARLVYADFLQENGESGRAAFIRAQIELSTLSEPEYKCIGGLRFDSPASKNVLPAGTCYRCTETEHCRYHAAEAVMLATLPALPEFAWPHQTSTDHGDWVARLNDRPQAGAWLDRGFVRAVRCEWKWWEKYGDSVLAREWVQSVRLTTQPRCDWPPNYDGPGAEIETVRGAFVVAGARVVVTPADMPRQVTPGGIVIDNTIDLAMEMALGGWRAPAVREAVLRKRWPAVGAWEVAECPPGPGVRYSLKPGDPVYVDIAGRAVPRSAVNVRYAHSVGHVVPGPARYPDTVMVDVGLGRSFGRPTEVEVGFVQFPDAEDD